MLRVFFLSLLAFSVVWIISERDLHAQTGHAVKRIPYNHPGLVVDVGVGLWAIPLPMDYDHDGDPDLIVSTHDVPYNGVYFFENTGSGVLQPGVRIGEGKRNITISYPNGKPRVTTPGVLYTNFQQTVYQEPAEIAYEQDFYAGRTNQWKWVDVDGDDVTDLVFGVSDWREYGWDDAYDASGIWTNGKIHGYVYWAKNTGSNERPVFQPAQKIFADGEPLDVYGCPSPNFVDWDGDGDLDLICGEFLDRISYFENIGSRTDPRYTSRGFLQADGQEIRMELQMLQVVVYDWDQDERPDIIVGQEDGRVAWFKNKGKGKEGQPQLSALQWFQQLADRVKCGALVTPCSVDWDGDGDEDLICGNTAGFIEWIENLGGGESPRWAASQRLSAGGAVIRYQAGDRFSIQGPAEAKWGYTVPYVADWNMDGLPDILVNTLIGKIEWLENIGTRSLPELAAPKPVKVAWNGDPPKPAWNWWDPGDQELVVQWRTRPVVLDYDQNGINDLIVIDHEGYLSWFEREKQNRNIITLPGKRVFLNPQGGPLRLNDGEAGKSGRRKLDLVDWDQDGDLDLLINSPRESPAENRNIAWYENIKQEHLHTTFRYGGDITSDQLEGHTTSPTTVDWNGDGVRDLLVGGEDGYLYHYPRTARVQRSARID